jgi:hypothetical protein
MTRWLSASLIIALSACQSSMVITDDTRMFAAGQGSSLKLNQYVQIPAQKARVYFQLGKPVLADQLDKFKPWCELEIKTLKDTTQTLAPDLFTITKIDNDSQFIEQNLDVGRGVAAFGSQAYDLVPYATLMYVQSTNQPDVLRLICVRKARPATQGYPTLREMRAVLGDFIHLDIRPQP